MPEFVNPFSGAVPRKINKRELTRAIRLSLSAEEEAIHLYEALADATDNALAKEVMQDIANEERVHVGEFQRLLSILLDDEDRFMAEGAREVDEMNMGESEEEDSRESGGDNAASIPTVGKLKNRS
jgi:rubrerythrin